MAKLPQQLQVMQVVSIPTQPMLKCDLCGGDN